MDNFRIIALCTQAIEDNVASREELRAVLAPLGGKVPSLRGKNRDALIDFLRGKFGNLYSVFDVHEKLHVVGGTTVVKAAERILAHPYLWSEQMPRSVGGSADTVTILKTARYRGNYLAVRNGAVQQVRDDPLSKVKPAAEDTQVECGASGAGHSYGPHGPNGKLQCEYCGNEMPPAVPGKSPALEKGEAVHRAVEQVSAVAASAASALKLLAQRMAGLGMITADTAKWLTVSAIKELEGIELEKVCTVHDEVILGVTYGPIVPSQPEHGMLYLTQARVEEFTPGERWVFDSGYAEPPPTPPTHALQRLWGEK